MDNIKPLKDIVLVAENKREATTASGIILESGTGDSKTATILAIGPKVESVKVGDKVLINWTKGQIVSINGAQRVMIKEEDIVAVLE